MPGYVQLVQMKPDPEEILLDVQDDGRQYLDVLALVEVDVVNVHRVLQDPHRDLQDYSLGAVLDDPDVEEGRSACETEVYHARAKDQRHVGVGVVLVNQEPVGQVHHARILGELQHVVRLG